MNKANEKIKDEALKQLFRFKMEQLRNVRYSFDFSHPIAFETIYLFSHSFDKMYEDEKMLSILDKCYREFQTNESRLELLDKMNQWIEENNYDRSQVFG